MSTLATAGAGAVIARDPLRRLAQPRPRRALLRPRLRRALLRRRRRLYAYRMAIGPAPPTVSAAAEFAFHPAFPLPASAPSAAKLAAPAPPAKSAVTESLAAGTEPVAKCLAGSAMWTLTAVPEDASTASAKACDCLPNGFPCTRSGLSASVAAPGPSLCPYAPECVEDGSLLKKSLLDQSVVRYRIRTPRQQGQNTAMAGF